MKVSHEQHCGLDIHPCYPVRGQFLTATGPPIPRKGGDGA